MYVPMLPAKLSVPQATGTGKATNTNRGPSTVMGGVVPCMTQISQVIATFPFALPAEIMLQAGMQTHDQMGCCAIPQPAQKTKMTFQWGVDIFRGCIYQL